MISRHQQMFYPVPVWNPIAKVRVWWTISSTTILLATEGSYEDGEGQTHPGTSMVLIGQAEPVMVAMPYAEVSQWLIAPGGQNPLLPGPTPTYPSGIGNQ